MKYSLIFLLISGCAGIHAENDAFNPFQKNQDSQYTHGSQFDLKRETNANEQQTYSIGQTIYTPADKQARITEGSDLEKDRPYTGFLYGQYRDSISRGPNTFDTFGFQIGCVGICSWAEESQRIVHKLLHDERPAYPDDDKEKSEPGFILEGQRDEKIYSYRDIGDFSVYGDGKFGNVIDDGAVGAEVRIGYALDSFSATPIVFKLPKQQGVVAYCFGKAEERGVAYNQFLDGSLFQTEPHTVTSEPFVDEEDLGITLGYGIYKINYTWTRFGKEWRTEGEPASHAFAGIDLEY